MTERKIKMNKKRNISIKALFALALVVIMSLGSLTTVFAAPGPISGGTQLSPAQAVIGKELRMAEGTTTPAATFTFQFAAKQYNDDNTTATTAAMPAIADKSVTFASTDTGNTSLGLKTVTKDTASLFAGITWPRAGIYTYTVTELSNSYTTNAGETMTYSTGSYDISVYVVNGNPNYIEGIGTYVVTPDHAGQTAGDKTDPQTSTVTGAPRAMVFTNTFTKMNGGTDVTDPSDQTLAISKTVAGAYGDQTKYFSYGVTVTQSVLSTGNTYKGYVVEGGNVVTAAANGTIAGTDPVNGNYINFPSGTAVTVNLKHGQSLAFIDNEVGSSYVANEAAAASYTPTASIIVNGGTPIALSSGEGTSLSTASRLIGENANSAAFTNTYKNVTPTGIALNNLPFIMIIVLALGAFAAFIVVKSRKRA